MCGIAGFAGASSEETLLHMLAAVAHRGHDDSGVLIRTGVGLAHARLAVIDTSSAGKQPMQLPGGHSAIVFNGEIYNYKELRRELEKEGRKFSSDSDTEVLLHLYETRGEDFLSDCVGMFAIAVYDFEKKKLLVARDRMGEKPLYWCIVDGTFFFASELSALMESRVVRRNIDMVALGQYLAFDYVPTPRTILENVYKLEPGRILVFDGTAVRTHTFWALPREILSINESEAIRELDRRLSKSVAGQLLADVPLGVFLSGGIDSSTVAYYAQQAAADSIDTFSIGFDESTFDESEYARTVANHIGSRHHEEILSSADTLALLPLLPTVFSEPVADASVLPTMLLSQFTRKSVTVALGGDGGDELFAGYPTFVAEAIFPVFRSLPTGVRDFARSVAENMPASHENFSFGYNLKKLVSTDEQDPIRRHMTWLGTFSDSLHKIAGPAFANPSRATAFESVDALKGEVDPDNALLWAYARRYLMDQVLVKVDRASMHYALETRAPLLDHRLVEYMFSLPHSLKYRGGTTKYLLKKLMKGKLPDHIINRKKKGFGIPLARWLTGPLKSRCEDLLSRKSLSHGLFNMDYVERLIAEHMQGSADRRKELWNLMAFQLWYDRWMR